MSDKEFTDDIINRLSEQMNVDRDVFFISKNSHSKYKAALFYILRHRTKWSLSKIGRSIELNQADTSNVVHSVKVVSSMMTLYWKGFADPHCEAIENTLKQTTNLLDYEIRELA